MKFSDISEDALLEVEYDIKKILKRLCIDVDVEISSSRSGSSVHFETTSFDTVPNLFFKVWVEGNGVIAKIRKDIDDGNTSEVGLAIRILVQDLWHYENANVEHMVTHLFDLSMKYTIGSVEAEHGDWSSALRAVNGRTYPIVQYKLTIVPSTDYQTNITPILVDFLRNIVNPFVYDRVVPKRRNIMPRLDFVDMDVAPFVAVPHYYNRWEWLDEMLKAAARREVAE